ncbi:macrolide family glycosyltransferase [Bacillus sp. TH12]|uniref:macrolide family glycosyltransferase n=1 Tax=Bacillus sp. TH12 TaxID=2796378 RepID=UPI0019113BFF|nr:macrolide family glycosyltransferase [Bacillus sp. TH12]MBK5503326.1 glycosyl transferase [Bacillus sp. TH12]
MSKVLFINFPGEGHVNPTIGIVSELIQRGEKVVYYCIEDYRDKIKKTGAEFRTYENFRPKTDINKDVKQKVNQLDMLSNMISVMDRLVKDILSEIEGEQFDYVIYDHHFAAGYIIASALQLPKISSCTTFAFNDSISLFGIDNSKYLGEKSPLNKNCIDIINKWKEQYGVTYDSFRDVINHPGDITIVYTSKEYQPYANEFDDSFIFVGPSITPRHDVEDFPIEDLKGKKVIFISMGTILNQQTTLYEKCFEAFKDTPATIVLAIGKKTNIEQFKNVPPNFILYKYVPQLEVLQHTDVFITHGGMNSSSEALYYGVPLVVIPISADQPLVAKRVTELGAGVHLDKTSLTPEILREETEAVLYRKEFKENSCKIRDSFQAAGGYKKAVDEILHVLSKSNYNNE